jgi:hypothetical protein
MEIIVFLIRNEATVCLRPMPLVSSAIHSQQLHKNVCCGQERQPSISNFLKEDTITLRLPMEFGSYSCVFISLNTLIQDKRLHSPAMRSTCQYPLGIMR